MGNLDYLLISDTEETPVSAGGNLDYLLPPEPLEEQPLFQKGMSFVKDKVVNPYLQKGQEYQQKERDRFERERLVKEFSPAQTASVDPYAPKPEPSSPYFRPTPEESPYALVEARHKESLPAQAFMAGVVPVYKKYMTEEDRKLIQQLPIQQTAGNIAGFAATAYLAPELGAVKAVSPVVARVLQRAGVFLFREIMQEFGENKPSLKGFTEKYKETLPLQIGLTAAALAGLKLRPGDLSLFETLKGKGYKFGAAGVTTWVAARKLGKSNTEALKDAAMAGGIAAFTGGAKQEPLYRRPQLRTYTAGTAPTQKLLPGVSQAPASGGLPVPIKQPPTTAVPVKPKPQVPVVQSPAVKPLPFKNTNEAIAFGKKATPAEVANLKAVYKQADAVMNQLQKEGKLQESFVIAQENGIVDEAISASEGKLVERGYKKEATQKPEVKTSLEQEAKKYKNYNDFTNSLSDMLYRLNKRAKAYGKKGSPTDFRGYFPEKQQTLYDIKDAIVKKYGEKTGTFHVFKDGGFGEMYRIGDNTFHTFMTEWELRETVGTEIIKKHKNEIATHKNITKAQAIQPIYGGASDINFRGVATDRSKALLNKLNRELDSQIESIKKTTEEIAPPRDSTKGELTKEEESLLVLVSNADQSLAEIWNKANKPKQVKVAPKPKVQKEVVKIKETLSKGKLQKELAGKGISFNQEKLIKKEANRLQRKHKGRAKAGRFPLVDEAGNTIGWEGQKSESPLIEYGIEKSKLSQADYELAARKSILEGSKKEGIPPNVRWFADPVKAEIAKTKDVPLRNMYKQQLEAIEKDDFKKFVELDRLVDEYEKVKKPKKDAIINDLKRFITEEQSPEIKEILRLQVDAINQEDIASFDRLKILENSLRERMDFLPELGVQLKKKFIGIDEETSVEDRQKYIKEMEALLKTTEKQLAQKTKRIKQVINSVVRKTPIKKIVEVDEYKALKTQIRKEVRAAKLGFKEGRGYQQLVDKEIKARKAVVKRAIDRARKTIKGLDLKHMSPKYRLPIQAIINDIDLAKPTTRTIRRLERMAKFIEENPDNTIPQKDIDNLRRLEKQSLRDMSLDDIDSLVNTIKGYVHQQKLKNSLIMKGKYQNFDVTKKEALANLELEAKVASDPNNISTKDFEKEMSKLGYFYGLGSENAELVTSRLDTKEGGIIQKVLYGGLDKGTSDKYNFKHEAQDFFKEKLKGIDPYKEGWSEPFYPRKQWAKKVDYQHIKLPSGKTVTLTKGERVALSLALRNEKNLRHLMGGGFSFTKKKSDIHQFSEADYQAIVDSMTPSEQKFADTVYEYFNTIQNERINEVSNKVNGYDIATEENYYPIRINELDQQRKDFLKQHQTPGNMTNFTQQTLEGQGSLKERTNASNAIILEDVFSTVYKSIDNISAYYGLAIPLRNAKMLLFDKEFAKTLTQTRGPEYMRYFKSYLQDVENFSHDNKHADRLILGAVNKIDIGILGLNPWVIFKQPISLMGASTEIDFKYLKKAKKPSTVEEMSRVSPQLRERFTGGKVTRELGEVNQSGAVLSFFTDKEAITSKIMAGIKRFDYEAIGRIHKAVTYEVEDLYPELTRFAKDLYVAARTEEIVRKTQPTFEIKDRSEVGRTKSDFVKFATKYTSQRNKNLMILRRAGIKYNNSEKKAADKATYLKVVAIVTIMNSFMIWSINAARSFLYGREDKKNKTLLQKTLKAAVTMLGIGLSNYYFVGDAFNSIVSKIERGSWGGDDIENPIWSSVNSLLSAVADTVTAVMQATSNSKGIHRSGSHRGERKWKVTAMRATNEALRGSQVAGNPFYNLVKLAQIPFNIVKKIEDRF